MSFGEFIIVVLLFLSLGSAIVEVNAKVGALDRKIDAFDCPVPIMTQEEILEMMEGR